MECCILQGLASKVCTRSPQRVATECSKGWRATRAATKKAHSLCLAPFAVTKPNTSVCQSPTTCSFPVPPILPPFGILTPEYRDHLLYPFGVSSAPGARMCAHATQFYLEDCQLSVTESIQIHFFTSPPPSLSLFSLPQKF